MKPGVTGLALFLLAHLNGVSLAAPPTRTDDIAHLELAPSDLGEALSEKILLLATNASGKEVYLYDQDSGHLTTYQESGRSWGDPIELGHAGGLLNRVNRFFAHQSDAPALRLRVGAKVLLGEATHLRLYDRRGQALAETAFVGLIDVVETGPDRWAVSILDRRGPGHTGFLGESAFEDTPPVLFTMDEDFAVGSSLASMAGDDVAPERSLGVSLLLAARDDKIYAATTGTYTVYEFDSNLKLRATYRDPELQFEGGRDEEESEAVKEKLLESARQMVDMAGDSLTEPSEDGPPPSVVAFNHKETVRAMAWDSSLSRLVLLLAPGTAEGSSAVLDLLDPLTRTVSRFRLVLPSDVSAASINQMATGHSYLWFRSRRGSAPTLRLDKMTLYERGKPLGVPDVVVAAE